MNTPIPNHVAEYLLRIRRETGFQGVIEYLRVELEDAKTSLVKADASQVQRLQGRAQALMDIVDLVDPKPLRQLRVQTLP